MPAAPITPGTAPLAWIRRHATEFLLRPAADTKILGFKEIRYEPGHFSDYDDMLDYLLFLDKLFPGIGYLMNVRDPAAAARSGWWPERPNAVDDLSMARTWLAQAVEDLNLHFGQERAVLVAYEDWSRDWQVLVEAFTALGLPRDDAAVRQVTSTRLDHGPHGETA